MGKEHQQKKELNKTAAASRIWMNYFNNYLYAAHLITEADRKKMKLAIDSRYGRLPQSSSSDRSIQWSQTRSCDTLERKNGRKNYGYS